MSKFKKLMILTFTMIFAVAVSATIVSFSFAGKGEDGSKLSMADNADAGSAAGSGLADDTSNIDHIIEKANDENLTLEERQFHILQIVSDGNTNTSLKSYVDSDGFRQHVINANKSIKAEMPKTIGADASIVIDVMTVADLQTLVAASTDYSRITIADLVYISNNPVSGKSFASGNDIPEDIYNVLHTYAIGDDKPLIIDYAGAAADSPTSMRTLVTNVLAGNYIKFRSFEWTTGVTMQKFLDRSESVYIPIDLSDEKYKDGYVSKIAVVYDSAAPSTTMYDAITGDKKTFIDNAYYKKGYKPADISVEKIEYTDAAKMTAEYLNGFDAIYLENGTYANMSSGTSDAFNILSKLSYAKKHIIFSGALKASNTSSSVGTGTNNETNFSELLYLVGTSEGIARYQNIMLSNFTMFDTMTADPAGTQEAANEVAKLLKSSTYREYGNNSASGKKFNVLEIQPCYPIDTELAKKQNNYYTQPDNVYKKSKEMTPDGKEYYAFELTIEKVMALTGLEESQINLVQVSTEELQGMKTAINGNYDLIYIGGNTSAMTPADVYRFNGSRKVGEFSYKVSEVKDKNLFLPNIRVEEYAVYDSTWSSRVGEEVTWKDGKTYKIAKLTSNVNMKGYYDGSNYVSNSTWKVGETVNGHTVVHDVWADNNTFTYGFKVAGHNQYDPSWKEGDKVVGDDGETHTVSKSWIQYTGTLTTNGGYPYYIMYSHTGNPVRLTDGSYGRSYGDYAVMGGNDISYDNMTGLMDYVDAGMPLIVSDDVTDAYKALAAKASNVYANENLDPDSNMYKFLVYALEQKNVTNYTGASEVTSDNATTEATTTSDNASKAADDAASTTPVYTVNTKSNVLADFDKDDVIAVSNLSKKYGDTLTSYAVVFNDGKMIPDMVKDKSGKWVDYEAATPVGDVATASASLVQTLLKKTNSRPTMKLSKIPNVYVANSPSSYVTGRELSFTYELDANGNDKIDSFQVILYIDDNSNGLFTDAGEAVKKSTVKVSGGKATGTLSYTVSADFYGPINWKIEATAIEKQGTKQVYGAAINYSAVSKIARTTQDKQLVNILQIMPTVSSAGSNQSEATLYFCPECQLANTDANYNPTLDSTVTAKDGFENYTQGIYQNYHSWATPGPQNSFLLSSKVPSKVVDYAAVDETTLNSMHFGIGLHQHEFGIWKYDSSIQYDDWDSNLADTLTGEDGDFEFNINIFDQTSMTTYQQRYSNNEIAKLQKAYEAVKNDATKTETEIKEAKKKLTDAQAVLRESAAHLKESYENYKTLANEAETDLRNVLTHFASQYVKDASGNYTVANSALRKKYGFEDGNVKDPTVFQTALDSSKYWDIYSNNRTNWRDHDYQGEDPSGSCTRKGLIKSAADDKLYVFTEGGKTYRLGKEYQLLHIYKKKADGSNGDEVLLSAYTGSKGDDGYPDVLDYTNYNYEYATDQSQVRMTYSFNKYYYQNWADANSRALIIKEKYEDKMRASYGKDWMEYYGMILLGAAENFGNQDLSQDVCDALKVYEKDGGNMLLFHDTMTKTDNAGAYKLTNTLAETFGLDRFHLQVDSEDSNKYALKSGYDQNRYFTTVLNNLNPDKFLRSTTYDGNGSSGETVKRTLVGVSTAYVGYYAGTMNGSQVDLPYRYASFSYQIGAFWARDIKTYQTNLKSGNYGTNRASQLNNGIITSYPFGISKELNISSTHNQYLALDVEDKEVITWYTLSGANNVHDGSSLYSADPGDAADNYFIYSKGNVNYCGAGHSKVTGPLTDNNDERMLFINIICNSARKSAIEPSIEIYDPDTKVAVPNAKNKYIKQNADGEPYIEVNNESADVKFGFKALLNSGTEETLKSVKVYFQYEGEDGKQVTEVVAQNLVDQNNAKVKSDIDYYFNTADKTAKKVGNNIQLKPEYFQGYDDYTYIYIEVESENSEKPVVEKIRVDLVRDLFDLT